MNAPPLSPLFVVIEPSGEQGMARARKVCWASETSAGFAEGRALEAAATQIAEAADRHALHLADPLFDQPRLEVLFAEAGLAPPPEGRDWLLALAPFGQARNLAAILDVAATRAGPENPAGRLLEAWREARIRSEKKRRQPRT